MKRYALNLLIAIDQLVNAILRGDPDETLSSRAHRMRIKRTPGWLAGGLKPIRQFVGGGFALQSF